MKVELVNGLTPIFLIRDPEIADIEIPEELETITCELDDKVATKLLIKQDKVMLQFQELQQEIFDYFELYLIDTEDMEMQ